LLFYHKYIINFFKKKGNEKNQEFKLTIENRLPETLLGDVPRINQVLSILVDNAIKFTPERGKVYVNINYDKNTNTLEYEVKDNGIGISKENQKYIFDAGQLDASASRSHEGAGLGLSIALSLIKIMKGRITLKSVLNKGTLFRVELPFTQ